MCSTNILFDFQLTLSLSLSDSAGGKNLEQTTWKTIDIKVSSTFQASIVQHLISQKININNSGAKIKKELTGVTGRIELRARFPELPSTSPFNTTDTHT